MLEIRITDDGSPTVYSDTIGETYHSSHGAINESMHIYLNAGFEQCLKQDISVLEVGFGTGLNAVLTLLAAERRSKVCYTGIEKYPLDNALWMNLKYEYNQVDLGKHFANIHTCEWGTQVEMSPNFNLIKIKADFSSLSLQGGYDVIYYDAFSPDKQPELWTEEVFNRLYQHTNQLGVLTTYCAKGAVRRAMQTAGYDVERIRGPLGKREILRAVKC
jgi:tRNA U34 5-methylaminomethyl-2-thiouridine-forming methyltransferase MnmC